MADEYRQNFNDSLSVLNDTLRGWENRSGNIRESYDANTIKELTKVMKSLPENMRGVAKTALDDLKKANEKQYEEEREKRREEQSKYLSYSSNQWASKTAEFISNLENLGHSLTQGFKEAALAIGGALAGATSKLEGVVDKHINTFLNAQQGFYYGFNGLAGGAYGNYSNMMSNFNSVMNAQNYVNQADMFNNMSTLVNRGIVSDVEQKAFLQTLASSFGMEFNATDNQLNRLIRIQHEDYTANRLAVEYSLKEFLNQNYRTSEYIKEGFSQASRALLQSQSLMSSELAARYEATVQTWLGSYYSVGVSSDTTSRLAEAINRLGSGNISNLGNYGDMSTLLLMGASRAGMNIGDILNSGFTSEQDINKLMTGVSSYLIDMGANSSNVVRSQLASIFGVDISDLAAISNNGINFTGGANANAGYALSGMTGLVPQTTRLSNTFENLMFGFGSRIAEDPNRLQNYMINKNIVEPLGGMLSGVGSALSNSNSKLLGALALPLNLAGLAMQSANLITILRSTIGSDALSNFKGNLGSSLDGSWLDIFSGGPGGSLLDIYNDLGMGSGNYITSSGPGVSGSIAINKTGGAGNLLSGSRMSMNGALSDMGVNIEGVEEDQYDPVENIDTNVGLIVDLLTTTNTNISDIRDRINNLYSFGGLANV